jgi:hypothetical protein
VAASAVVSEFWDVSLSGSFPQTTVTATIAAAIATANDENRVTISITTDNGGPYTFSHDVQAAEDEDDVAAALATLIDAHAELTATPTTNTIAIGVEGVATTMNAGSISASWIGAAADATTIQITVTGGPATDDNLTVVTADITVDGGGLQEFDYSVQNAEDADAAATGLAALIDASASLVAGAPAANVITVTLDSVIPEFWDVSLSGSFPQATTTATIAPATATGSDENRVTISITTDNGGPYTFVYDVQVGEDETVVAAALAGLVDAHAELTAAPTDGTIAIGVEGAASTMNLGSISTVWIGAEPAAIDTHTAYPDQRVTVTGGGTGTLVVTVLGITAPASGRNTAELEVVIDGGAPVTFSHPVTSGQTINQVAAALAVLITAEEAVDASVLDNVITVTFIGETALHQVVKGLKRIKPA